MDSKERLQHLWNVAKACGEERQSRWYCRQMMRMAEASDDAIRLGDGFYENVCSCCGSIFLPMVNCRVRFHRLMAVRNHFNTLLISRVVPSSTNSNSSDDDGVCLTYYCFICARLTVFDHNIQKNDDDVDLLVEEKLVETAVSKPKMDAIKLQRLQKILNKQRNSSLGSFLQSTRKPS